MQFAENVQDIGQEGYCFVMTMQDLIQLKQPWREFKKYSANFLNIRLTAQTLAPNDFHMFGPLKNHIDDRRLADDKEAETAVKNFSAVGFDTGKVMEQVYQCLWRIC
jgi:hypothetical protein